MSYSLSGSLALHLDDLMIIYAHTHTFLNNLFLLLIIRLSLKAKASPSAKSCIGFLYIVVHIGR